MNYKNIFLSISISCLVACVSSQQSKVRLRDEIQNISLSFQEKNSLGTLSSSSGTTTFKTNIPEGFELDFYKLQEIDNIAVVYYQFADHNSAAGKIIAFEKGQLKEAWKKDINSFNISIPLFNNEHIYISAAGEITKLILKTGATVWEQKNLSEKLSFVDIETVTKKGDQITINQNHVFSDLDGKLISQ